MNLQKRRELCCVQYSILAYNLYKRCFGSRRLKCAPVLQLQVLRLFSSVFGIGAKTALDLYARGHRSLDDLRGDPTLTRQARLGLQYYQDIGVKMRRTDVARIEDLVKREAQAVCPGVSGWANAPPACTGSCRVPRPDEVIG
jgi:hypothetical protein